MEMNLPAIIVLFAVLLACPTRAGLTVRNCMAEKAQTDPATAELLRVLNGSKRVQRVLTEAQSGTEYRICFVAITADEFQGFTTHNEGEDRKGITVHIEAGLSDQLTEHLLAHELFHIVLRKQGYPTEVRDGLTAEQRNGTDLGRVLMDATRSMMNCYEDARIDHLMSTRGFTPKVLNRRQSKNMMAQGLQMQPQQGGIPSLLRKDYALVSYCLSIRERDFDMGDIYRSWSSVDPTLAEDTLEIEQSVANPRYDDVLTYIDATKKLRIAAGFDGLFQFLNPSTQNWE